MALFLQHNNKVARKHFHFERLAGCHVFVRSSLMRSFELVPNVTCPATAIVSDVASPVRVNPNHYYLGQPDLSFRDLAVAIRPTRMAGFSEVGNSPSKSYQSELDFLF